MRSFVPEVRWRQLLPGQVSQIRVGDASTGASTLLHESHDLVLEAPNWSPDGSFVVVNAAGALYRIDVADPRELHPIRTGTLDDNNNDHLITRDGRSIITSSEGSGHLYVLPVEGGDPVRITDEVPGTFSYFLQGLSRDGVMLSFAGGEVRASGAAVTNLFVMPVGGGTAHRLTDLEVSSVGCDYGPDDEWVYFNSELHARVPGDSQIYRARPDLSELQQLTDDERVHWFPKVSPDGRQVLSLSFPPGTIGHDANVPVSIHRMDPDGSAAIRLLDLFGGQGTMNVANWAPDSSTFVYAAYPIAEHGEEQRTP